MNRTTGARLPATLNDLFQLAMMLTMAAILTAAMVLQYDGGEIPCPLCLLQRVAMFGVCFGMMMHFRHGYSARNDGVGMLFALLLIMISVRQTLLDIYPRPGHSYIGSSVLGLHMPVWSVVIATAILAAFAIKFAILGDEHLRDRPPCKAREPLRDRDCPDQPWLGHPSVRRRRVPHLWVQAAGRFVGRRGSA